MGGSRRTTARTRSPHWNGCGSVGRAWLPASERSGARRPSTGVCSSTASVTTSRLETRRSMRCEGCCCGFGGAWCGRCSRSGSARFHPASAPALTTVPSTVRSRPSESEASVGRGRRMRLHLRAPRAQQKPQQGQRQPDNALRSTRRHATQHGGQRQCGQHQTGLQPESFGRGNPHGKEPGRMKQRDGARAGA